MLQSSLSFEFTCIYTENAWKTECMDHSLLCAQNALLCVCISTLSKVTYFSPFVYAGSVRNRSSNLNI